MDEQLLIRFLTHTCTSEDLRLVDQWIASGKPNADWLFEMERIWSLKDELRFSDRREIEEAYNRFTLSLGKSKNAKPHFYIYPILKYVAAVIIIGLLGLNLYKMVQPATVGENTVEVPKGQRASLMLSAGTKIWLNSQSKLIYPTQFSDKERNVRLEGEAFFDVAHKEHLPFVVHSPLLAIKVLGTKFNVKAYFDEKSVVTLAEGKVEVETNDCKNRLTLKPNEQVSYSVLTHEYMGDPNAYDQYRYTYFIPLSMSIQNGYSSFEPMQDLVDAYWKVDGKTLPEKIQVDARKANYEKIWNYAKNLSEEDYKTFATSPELMSYDYMKEFKNRDSRLYVTLMFPFKGWHETAVGEFYYKWNPDVINKDGNESWTGFSYRKMVAWEPYIASVYGSADDYPTIRYAEVLLTFAEAHLMTTGYDDQVRFALNQLRDRCGMPDVPESLGTQEAIDFLRNERRIELAVEGHRYDDVRRYGNEYCQKYLQGPSTAPNGAVVVDKKWNERLMLMPIPTTAIDVNPLLKEDQNPGY